MDKKYTDINAEALSKWIENGWEWGVPITHEAYVKATQGDWQVVLTPQKPVPRSWFRPHYYHQRLKGTRLLGLASGGGQQMPIFASLGATCTVLDYCDNQLDSERMVAQREGYDINIVKADMTRHLPFEDNTFELIFHPVSNCYVEDVQHIWDECFRVLKPGGVLLAGFDNGINFLFDEEDSLKIVNKLPYNPLKDPALYQKSIALDGSVQFSHTLEEQIGGQLKAGFQLTDLYEDSCPGPGIGEYYPEFIATRAVKPE